MTGLVVFDPLVPIWALAVLAGVSAVAVGVAVWKRLAGWALRGLAALALLGTLTGPVWQVEDRALKADIVMLIDDQSASQRLSDRPDQASATLDVLQRALRDRPNTEIHRVTVADGDGDSGTRMMEALADALNDVPRDRVAGIIALSDGQVHDLDHVPDLPAPMHLLLSGRDTDWDRRLIVRNAPAFAIIGEPVTLTLRIEDSGAVPASVPPPRLAISVDGGDPRLFTPPVGQDIDVPVNIPHGGRNVIRFSVAAQDDELTDRNNAALVQINGVRDRLRVLLVSGEPHAGGRTWRNLLKSDSSVDLVHFTILRPPEKQDGVPVDELSLIAFPTRELFLEKVDDFDLIIFDRYKRRGILPALYLENVADYVRKGGAVLIAAGPDFASADSIYRSPLASILPAEPTARVIEDRYLPTVSAVGARHPVTAGMTADPDGKGDWGAWLRQIDLDVQSGTTVMTGYEDRPLLVLDRVGEGRVALLASDQAWLWGRGYEGGGPQLELLRRLAHWMMKEPELEEEALWAEAVGQRMQIFRRTLNEAVEEVTVTLPDGTERNVTLRETSPGQFEAGFDGPEIGLYRLSEGDQSAVIGLGPAAPREFEQTIASGAILSPVVKPSRGGVFRMQDGAPSVRSVREGRPAAGRGWLGLTPRNAYDVRDVWQVQLLPAWLVVLLASGALIWGWLREGQR